LCDIMLKDSAHIQESEAEWKNRKAKRAGGEIVEPIYTVQDAEASMKLFKSCFYDEDYQVFDQIRIRFLDAGHLLGSSSILVTITEEDETRTILFSGDVGNVDRPLIRDPQKPEEADFVIIESTYGDRTHGERIDYVAQLSEIIQRTLDRGGNVVIPSFAIGRTQILLYLIRIIKEQGLVKGHDNFPVYVDSPLAVEATAIYSSPLTSFFDEEALELLAKGINPIHFENLHLSVTTDESKQINFDREPKVILSASGMCEAGRIRHHLKHNLWRPESTVVFVGYQVEGTLGRKIKNGADKIKLFNEEIAVKAEVLELADISGHADRDMLLDWLGNLKQAPRKVFVNHGDDEVCDIFADSIREKLGFDAVAPYSGDAFDLLSEDFTERAAIVKAVKKKQAAHEKVSAVYNALLEAGQRLLRVIEKNKGGANKDLEKFTERINSLCDRYER
ncbi:MAG: MBL fold metallo-hydrolase, partial [Lachnospiraceae bacterium]|nr:MBL fold metallo-hydrolase [Lachnospiraceae bacterium]